MIGDSDDSLSLIDYFENRKYETVKLSTVLRELMLDRYLGKGSLQQSKEMFFVMTHADGRSTEKAFMISINPVIDLCAVLVECIHAGRVGTKDLIPSSNNPVIIKIDIEKEDLTLLINELDLFCTRPLSYDLFDFVPEDDMLELAGMCKEILVQLKEYCSTAV